MDAPKGRYRVEEKDRRLTVIDTATGAPATSVMSSPRTPAAPPNRPGASPGPDRPAAVSSPGLFDRYTRLLLGLVVKRWDEEGRALVAWEWEQNGRKQRWDAALGPAEQKRLGRAMVAITAFPIFVLLTIVTGFALTWLLLPIALPATAWGIWSLTRLQRETGNP
ncbi:MAG TPA: hypothetical protein VE053_02755 [Allosphingosinicella sp.]|nr:hypothetical protein [Allosphingosinicella sp.]